MGFRRRLFDLTSHRVCVPAELVRAEVCPGIVGNKGWGTQIYVDPARSQGFPRVFGRHTLEEVRGLEVGRLVDRMEYWFPLDPTNVRIDRVVELFIVLQGELEPARASAIDLAVVAEPGNFT